jgi:hypothetical protein
MERRKALKLTATIFGGTVIGSQVFLAGCSSKKEPLHLITNKEVSLLDEISEIILPASDESPGAKAAHIGSFIKVMVNDCFSPKEIAIFIKGLVTINQAASASYGMDFKSLIADQKIELLTKFDIEARESEKSNTLHFFNLIKQLTIWGYFTSEPGVRKALRYNPVPGRYEGCIAYNGENSWAQ